MRALIVNCSPVRDGATAEIAAIAAKCLAERYETRSICIDDFRFGFCRGCRTCHATAKCVQSDDVDRIIDQFNWTDVVLCVSPSYWADVPAQFKAFIDRCTPWCNTHEPHAFLKAGKRGYAIALRTGPGMHECEKIIETIRHFYGHMLIECCDDLGLCGIEYKQDVQPRQEEIEAFCGKI